MKHIFKLVNTDIQYNDENYVYDYCCALGEYNENDKLCQEYDDHIFYWFESEEEIKEFMKKEIIGEPINHNEFKVLNYKILEWKD